MRSRIIPTNTQRCINVDSMAHNTVSMAHTVIKRNNVESMLLQRDAPAGIYSQMLVISQSRN